MIHLGASARVDLTLWVVGVTDASKELTASVLQAAQVSFFSTLINNRTNILFTRNMSPG